MALKDVFKVSRKTYFNPSAWLGYDTVKGVTRTIWDLSRGIFVAEAPAETETFEDAVKRFNLSEDDLKNAEQRYLMLSLLFAVISGCIFLYGFYLLFVHHAFLGFLLALAVCALLVGQTFQFSFLSFQTKHRKLGCTFDEWWEGKVNDNPTKPDEEAK
jgi:intracellular multiplication protein IcmV